MSSEINGLYLCKHYIPKELLTLILSHVPPAALISLALVCEEWNTVIKDSYIWQIIFKRKYPKREVKDLPWYIYYVLLSTDFFDTNLLKNWDFLGVWEFHKGPIKISSLQQGCIRYVGSCEYFINLRVRAVYSKILRKYKPVVKVKIPSCNHLVDIVILGTETGIKSYHRLNLKKIAESRSQVDYIIDDYPEDMEQIRLLVVNESDRICSLEILFDSIQHARAIT